MRITNIKKFIRSIIIITGFILIISLLLSKITFSYKKIEYKTICVSEGDTLWSIAKSNQENNNYYKNKDIRYIVNDLLKINNLKNSNINVNQKLLIPYA